MSADDDMAGFTRQLFGRADDEAPSEGEEEPANHVPGEGTNPLTTGKGT